MPLNKNEIEQILAEIKGDAEKQRRTLAKRRHDIYKDSAKRYLIEMILKEFGPKALTEMRLCPVNVLSKIVNKQACVYEEAPTRKAELESDQKLVDHYTKKLGLNVLMQKANRYFRLQGNTVVYARPVPTKDGKQEIKAEVTPPYLYSIIVDPIDKAKERGFVFSTDTDPDAASVYDLPSSTGYMTVSSQPLLAGQKDAVASGEIGASDSASYIFWTDDQHFTTTASGEIRTADSENPGENSIDLMPVINIAMDRDNEAWAQYGEDMVDLCIAVMMGWTDLLTIAKHQGFGQPVFTGEEKPENLQLGLNNALFLKSNAGSGVTPTFGYETANSPLDQYQGILMQLLKLVLMTKDIDPGSALGDSRDFASGFAKALSMVDTTKLIKADGPTFQKAEEKIWAVIAAWHNQMYDAKVLDEESGALSKFSPKFKLSVQLSEPKPLVSEDEVLARIEKKRTMGLQTLKEAIQELHPDLDDKQIDAKMAELQSEKEQAVKDAQAMIGEMGTDTDESDESADEEKPAPFTKKPEAMTA